jgi:hypothetical protein
MKRNEICLFVSRVKYSIYWAIQEMTFELLKTLTISENLKVNEWISKVN